MIAPDTETSIAVGVSVSESPDLWALGLSDGHLRDAMAEIALHVLASGRPFSQGERHPGSHAAYPGGGHRSGIVVVNLPGTSDYFNAPHGDEEKRLPYPEITSWMHIEERTEYERRYPYMPGRIIDNLVKPDVRISVAPWDGISERTLEFLIEAAFRNRANCRYDLRRSMRRTNS